MQNIIQFIFLFFAANSLLAADKLAGDIESAKKIVNNLCIACHAIDGNSAIPSNPKLAGQHADYLSRQLEYFKKGIRENAVMQGMVANLSTKDFDNLGHYFENQTLKLSAAKSNGKGSLGEKIFRAGISDKKLPACASCHGPSGHGIPGQFPRLNAQHSDYTISQLNAYKNGLRKNEAAKMMATIAQRLSDAEMQAVADYIEGLQ
ncbi:MAG: c-type cytochrome [Methylophilaceae bacterium]